MKTVAAKDKHSAPATSRAYLSAHRHLSPALEAQQTIMRNILRPDGVQTKADDEKEKLMQPKLIRRQEKFEDEEDSLQAKLIPRQTDNEEVDELIQTKLQQTQIFNNLGNSAKPISYLQPKAKTQQAEIQRILRKAGAQTKLTVGEPDDQHEQEADRVAEKVMAMPDSNLQRQTSFQEDDERVQTKSIADQITPLVQREEDEEKLQSELQRMNNDEDELKTKLQRMGNLEEDEIQAKLRRTEVEEEDVQTKLRRVSSEDEDLQTKLMRKQTEKIQAMGTPNLTDDAEQKIQQMRGQGEPLPNDYRQDIENKMGADFSTVRIHNNSSANDINRQINARAFTLGNDIYFATSEYSPSTAPGKKLLAHELTHVVQQGQSASRMIRRTPTEPLTNEYDNPNGRITTGTNKVIQIKNLRVPTFKNQYYQNPQGRLDAGAYNEKPTWRRNESTGGEERDTNQISIWEQGVREEADTKVETKLTRAHTTVVNGNTIYYLSYNDGKSFLFGTQSTIKERCRRPLWTATGQPVAMQVDHQLEYQTYGADLIDNMFLLAAETNSQSGREIRTEINEKVSAFVMHVQDKVLSPPTTTEDARTNYSIYFDPVQRGLGSYGAIRAKQGYYTQQHIQDGDHLDGLRPMSQRDINNSGILSGNAESINLFPSSTGGYHYTLNKDPGGDAYHLNTQSIRTISTQNFEITSVDFNALTKQGNIHIRVPSQAVAASLPVPLSPHTINPIAISPIEGIEWGGRFDSNSLKRQVSEALTQFPGLSPLNIDDVDINAGGIALTGTISPTAPLIGSASVNFSMEGQTLSVWKTFTADDFSVPSPFEINGASLSLGISNRGLFVRGNVGFGIEHIGQGTIGATAEANFTGETGISLSGDFNFDERIFGEGTQAQVRVAYANNQWSMGGTLTIPEDKVTGIKSATINVDYSEAEGFSASGDAELDVPGVESGHLEITHSEENGFAMSGEFTLSSDTPGIRGGNISAEVREREDGEGYAVSARGEAQPDIPGIDSNLIVSYDDGAFTAEVDANYARGMLSGSVNAGVTNRSVAEDGTLSETAEPGNPLIVYGGGSLTIQIAPWLQGTAGVQFAPNGEITVTGEIGLPDELEIFARREINRSLFNIAVQAPIFPGIVAEIGGGLSATAGIGPGVIDELRLGITYNPAREEETTITGDAHLNVPANAGLRLGVRAGIGLGVTGLSATGGLEIGGTLGIEGAAEAGVHVEWNPTRGLDLTATLAVHAQPAFTFDISGYVSVRALGFSVYDETWRLAEFTFGSDYRFGIRLPIHYQEGQPFDISTNDIEFEVPDIDTNQLLRGLISRIA